MQSETIFFSSFAAVVWLNSVQTRAPVCVCLHLGCHAIRPLVACQQPPSSAPFEVELDELCCIKQNKSSMCFYRDIPHTTKAGKDHFRQYKWDLLWWVYTQCVRVDVCVVTVPCTLGPFSRSYRCYLTKPTQTLLVFLLLCLVLWQTRGHGGPWPNRWETHFTSLLCPDSPHSQTSFACYICCCFLRTA